MLPPPASAYIILTKCVVAEFERYSVVWPKMITVSNCTAVQLFSVLHKKKKTNIYRLSYV